MTTAAAAMNMTRLNVPSCKVPMIGAPTTPATPARTVPMTQAYAEVLPSFTPRMAASSGLSTTARMWRPSEVWRSSTQSATATAAPVMNTTTWLLLTTTSSHRFEFDAGERKMPAGSVTCFASGMPQPKVLIPPSTM
ncbi:unannotated protein [freshwater metagenome]|uniref:Unannotated protein n=1 Tax=freshwater metagenome TaxID=449393 RepID=A0A6J7AX77_9ZZZZ